jgi:hypothetical protein
MKITQLRGSSLYQAHLNVALHDMVSEYEQLHERMQKQPPLTEETATAEALLLHYTLEQKRATALLLAASCVEAVANLYLSLKVNPDQFAVLERATFLEKWTVVPSLLVAGYTLPKDGELYQDVRRLQIRRNALLHLKEEVTRGDVVVHPGSIPEAAGDEYFFVNRCRSLPDRLASNLASFDKTGNMTQVQMAQAFTSTLLEVRRNLTAA